MPLLLPRTLAANPARAGDVAAAGAGEWAVTGAFRWAHRDPARFARRELAAFRDSWFGLASFAPAAVVEIAMIAPDALEAAARRLAAHLLEAWQAPDAETAAETAFEEIAFAQALCDQPPGTRLLLEREFNEQGLIERAVVADPARERA